MIPEPILIMAYGFLCCGLGALAVKLYYRGALRRKEHETWKAASLFHSRRTP